MNAASTDPARRAESVFRRSGGLLRMGAAIRAGIHRDTLLKMLKRGDIQRVTRGLYQLVSALPPSQPDLAIVATKVPDSVVCLISALAFHELTTQVPHEVYLAIDRNARPPRVDYPPIRVFRFSGRAYTEGIESHKLSSVVLRVYSREKTLADCFKYRNKIGLDTCLEALRAYKQQRRLNLDVLMKYAEICRVARVMRPYIEAIA